MMTAFPNDLARSVVPPVPSPAVAVAENSAGEGTGGNGYPAAAQHSPWGAEFLKNDAPWCADRFGK